MAFWGIEVKPGRPYTHPSSSSSGRLRVSQATLGIGSSVNRSIVQCNLGNMRPVFLCSLIPNKKEHCHLEMEFEEDDEVVFSVIGPRSVHLTGYYLSSKSRRGAFADSSESYGEDIGDADTDVSNEINDDSGKEDSFINDDVDSHSASPNPYSEDEDVACVEVPKEQKPRRKRLRKLRELSESDVENSDKNIANNHDPVLSEDKNDEEDTLLTQNVKDTESREKNENLLAGSTGEDNCGTEEFHNDPKADDADYKSALDLFVNAMAVDGTCEAEDSKMNQKKRKKRSSKSPESDFIKQENASEAEVESVAETENIGCLASKKEHLDLEHVSESENIGVLPSKSDRLDLEPVAESENLGDLSSKENLDLESVRSKDGCIDPPTDATQSREKRIKKKKRKIEKEKDEMKETEARSKDGCIDPPTDATQSREKRIKKKKRKIEKEKDEMKETEARSDEEEKKINDVNDLSNGLVIEEKKSNDVNVLSNGLVIEEVKAGNLDGAVASTGKRVTVHYIGKLKESGHVYDLTTRDKPFKFRLGKGHAIDGLELGMDGMRVGGKRRLIIPPELGYGTEGMLDFIAPNSWLILDVELLQVR